jgi:hypothetical protein
VSLLLEIDLPCLIAFCPRGLFAKNFIMRVHLEEGFCEGDFFILSPKHFVFVLLFLFSDAHIASHYLFYGRQKGGG